MPPDSAISISWLYLTHNRISRTKQSLEHNVKNAGYPWKEFLWCDNGSNDGTVEYALSRACPVTPDVFVSNRENVGVSAGYNRIMCLAKGEWVVITGQDMLMPENWLATFALYVSKIENTGVACMYSVPIETVPERKRGEPRTENGLFIQPAMPMGRRIFRRTLLSDVGYFREDLLKYGWEDVIWGRRAYNVCKNKGLLCYNIPDKVPYHLSQKDLAPEEQAEEERYTQWKKDIAFCEQNMEIARRSELMGDPYFNPYI